MPRIAVATELSWPLRSHYDLIRGIEDYAEERGGWTVEVSRYPEARMGRGIVYDGIIGRIEAGTLAAAREAGIPVVNCWINSPVAEEAANVQSDYHAAGAMAVKHLVARGLTRFVAFGVAGQMGSLRFAKGCREEAREAGLDCRYWQVVPEFEETIGRWEQFMEKVEGLAAGWQRPIGLLVSRDYLARALATSLLDLGWRIPEEVAVVSVGDNELQCGRVFPTLTSVNMGITRVGYAATKLLDALMAGGAAPRATTLVPPAELIVRQSSDVFAVPDKRLTRALRFMADHSSHALSVADVAKAAGVARQTLDKLFREHLDSTINNELLRLRCEHLKRLLLASDAPIRELCPQAGFYSETHVYRVFKKFTGLTPKQFRESRGEE